MPLTEQPVESSSGGQRRDQLHPPRRANMLKTAVLPTVEEEVDDNPPVVEVHRNHDQSNVQHIENRNRNNNIASIISSNIRDTIVRHFSS